MDNISTLAIGTRTNIGTFLGWDGERVKFEALQGWVKFVPTPERIASIEPISEEAWQEKVKAYNERVAHYLDNLPAGAAV
jgi:hypothetical protein